MTHTKTEKLLRSLQKGNELTAEQAVARFGFASTDSVRKIMSNLRYDGYAVYCNEAKYRIGNPTRARVAAGYTVVGT